MHFQNAEIFACSFKLPEIHWAAFFFRCFTLRFREKPYAKTQEVWLVYNALLLSYLLRQTKGFFFKILCFSFNKRSQKHAAAKTLRFQEKTYAKTQVFAAACF